MSATIEIGVDRFLFAGANAPSGADTNPVPDLLAEIVAADSAGLDAFGIGEHHTAEFADSSPAILLAAGAALTRRIRLSSAISILSVADPVRLMEDFATLDLVSNGRAEVIVGRGAYSEAYTLFGADPAEYEALFAEKLDLLLQLRSGQPINWSGRFRPTIRGQTSYPRPIQPALPIWVGATGSPETFTRAGTLGLPLAIAILGGTVDQLVPLVSLYREAGRRAGHAPDALAIALHAIGYVGETATLARDEFYPGYTAIFGAMTQKMGRAAATRAQFDAMTAPDQALLVGDVAEVGRKIVEADRILGGITRVSLQMTVGPLPPEQGLAAIKRLGEIRQALA